VTELQSKKQRTRRRPLLYGAAGKAIIDFFASGGQGDNPPAPGISDENPSFGFSHGLMGSIFLKNRGGGNLKQKT
jgi:hypothetical protein